jgi:hypothetical protein
MLCRTEIYGIFQVSWISKMNVCFNWLIWGWCYRIMSSEW